MEEREWLVLAEVDNIEDAKLQLGLGLTVLSAAGENQFDRGGLLYEINVARTFDASKELSEASIAIYQQVVIQAFANDRLPLNNLGQASVDNIINAMNNNLMSTEHSSKKTNVASDGQAPTRKSLGGSYEDSSDSRQSSFVEQGSAGKEEPSKSSSHAIPEVFRYPSLLKEDKEALTSAAQKFFSHIFPGKSRSVDREKFINLAVSCLYHNPALSRDIEQVLRDNKPNRTNMKEVDFLMRDIHSQLNVSLKKVELNAQEDKTLESKFKWFDKSSFSKNDQYLLEKFETAEAQYISSIVTPSGQTEPRKMTLIKAGVEFVNNAENKQQAIVVLEMKLTESSVLTKDNPPLAKEIMDGVMENLEKGASFGK